MTKTRILPCWFFIVFPTLPAMSHPPQATIEDKDLRPLNLAVSGAVTSSSSFQPFSDLGCKLTGKRIFVNTKAATYFITTDNTCGWGAALGPVWLVSSTKLEWKLILSSGGYSLHAAPPYTNGMPEIEISGGTAGVPLKEIFRYDGRAYRAIK
ncbi:hypothetical protein [Pseudomonas chlororaphis]|uniref:hypothetical protein n=1 Tax=Pseudomonas chlororaphis TaxID=587753 RepID=UPI000F55CA6A|nr:hypothetical protein [Pseudomonas chlororaphis]